jgi:hypothetical protein
MRSANFAELNNRPSSYLREFRTAAAGHEWRGKSPQAVVFISGGTRLCAAASAVNFKVERTA